VIQTLIILHVAWRTPSNRRPIATRLDGHFVSSSSLCERVGMLRSPNLELKRLRDDL